MTKGSGPVFKSAVARSVPFDNTGTDFDATNVQEALTEIGASASPGFSWGRSGNASSGTWLQNDSVPSNLSGRTVAFSNPKIRRIFTASEDVATYTLQIYEHEGNSVNLTLLTSFNVTSSRTGDSASIDIPVTSGKQLAVQVSAGSCRNIVVGVILAGGN